MLAVFSNTKTVGEIDFSLQIICVYLLESCAEMLSNLWRLALKLLLSEVGKACDGRFLASNELNRDELFDDDSTISLLITWKRIKIISISLVYENPSLLYVYASQEYGV